MIIKSMSRKSLSFGQLVEYMSSIHKADAIYNIYRNLYSQAPQGIEQEFRDNARYVPRRRNGVYLYHEILSITKGEALDTKTQKERLREIAHEYISRRASENLVYGALHDDHDDHLHYHLLVSSNPVGSSKKTRLSRYQFDRLKKDLEVWVLSNYPELEQRAVINKQAGAKLSNKGGERKRRTGSTPQRENLKDKLCQVFSSASSKQEFFTQLTGMGLELYARGNTLGVLDLSTGRKHRLRTLGVLAEFNAMSARVELAYSVGKGSGHEAPTGHASTAENAVSEPQEPTDDQKASTTEGAEPSGNPAEQASKKHRAEMESIRKRQQENGASDSDETGQNQSPRRE